MMHTDINTLLHGKIWRVSKICRANKKKKYNKKKYLKIRFDQVWRSLLRRFRRFIKQLASENTKFDCLNQNLTIAERIRVCLSCFDLPQELRSNERTGYVIFLLVESTRMTHKRKLKPQYKEAM